MLSIFLALLVAGARGFHITEIIVPPVVPPEQNEVDIECRYDANFTLINWFKGPNEFFRYRPLVTPSIRTFSVLGIGKVQVIACGTSSCHLRLGGLTEEATGLYRCDIERDVPPYKFESRKAYMEVHGHIAKKPILEGLGEEYGEDEEMQAHCRGAKGAEIRWYINGREVDEMRGSPVLRRMSSRFIYQGIPPMVTVQCAEFWEGRLAGSKEMKARWKEVTNRDERAQEQKVLLSPSANLVFNLHLLLVIGVVCLLL